jgi:hypothetical protein
MPKFAVKIIYQLERTIIVPAANKDIAATRADDIVKAWKDVKSTTIGNVKEL